MPPPRLPPGRGLLVEANPFAFAKLVPRRPATFRLESALCAKAGWMRFDLPAQRQADGCCGRASESGKHRLRCTPLGHVLRAIGVSRIDFFSLDVEGAEMQVLRGHDWGIPIGVLLIETGIARGQKAELHALLRSKGLLRLDDFHSPTGLNEVFYDPSLHTPRPANATGTAYRGGSLPSGRGSSLYSSQGGGASGWLHEDDREPGEGWAMRLLRHAQDALVYLAAGYAVLLALAWTCDVIRTLRTSRLR